MNLLSELAETLRANRKKLVVIGLGILSVFLIAVAVIYLLITNFDIRKQASTASCKQSIKTDASYDRINWSTELNIPSTGGAKDTRYYLRFVGADGKVCANEKVSVLYQYCAPNGVCEPQIPIEVWGNFITNYEGILRVDTPRETRDGSHTAMFKAAGSQGEWGNKISINLVSNPRAAIANTNPTINFLDYFSVTPGELYIYDSENKVTGTTATTRMQIEQLTSFCGVNVYPMRFTKENKDAYWNNYFPNTSLTAEASSQLRFMITDPNFNFAAAPGYNNTIWSPGSKMYEMKSIRDIADADYKFTSFTGSNDSSTPAYYLGVKNQQLPFVNFNSSLSVYQGWQEKLPERCISPYLPGRAGNASWRIRIELDNLTVNGAPGEFSYSGQALRVDYMESIAAGDPETSPMIKESWWYVKGIGLVKIDQKYFNGFNNGANCSSDPDCLADKMVNPQTITTLKKHYSNPLFTVSLSKNGETSTSVNVNAAAGEGYCLKLNSDFTGYLEAFDNDRPDLGAFKWEWVENGQACFSAASLSSAEKRAYNVKFRVWIPNDTFRGETRIGVNNLPWSNTVTLNLV